VIPEGEAKAKDLIEAVLTSSQKTVEVKQDDGSIKRVAEVDDDTVWAKLNHINSNSYGQAVFELKEWERNGNDAPRNMCQERALDIMHDIKEVGISVRRAYDAKGSETIGVNKMNSQTNILGMVGKNKQERVYTMKDKAKSSLFDGILGRDVEKDQDE